jgi:hypothetical protein
LKKLRIPSAATGFAIANGVLAVLVVVGVFAGLPTRWAPVDVPALLIVLLLLASAYALLRPQPWSLRVVRWAAGVVLALGLLCVFGLTLAIAFLSGVLGAVGSGGVTLFVMVVALVLPYLVIYPALQLVWAAQRTRAEAP